MRNVFAKRRLILDGLLVLFGMGSWVGVNGIFVQLPHIVDTAPEGWSLPSFMTVIIQLANIGPIVYAIIRKFSPKTSDKFYISGLLINGAIALMLIAWLYQKTLYIGEYERSVPFLILIFFVALVGCTSSVLFYPFMRHYKDFYLISYLIGEGMSGFIPAIIALIQGPRGNPTCTLFLNPNGEIEQIWSVPDSFFGPNIFLTVTSCLALISFLAFTIVSNSKTFDSEKAKLADSVSFQVKTDYDEKEESEEKDRGETNGDEESAGITMTKFRFVILLILMTVVNGLGNGIFTSLQTFSSLPYGNTAYHLGITLGAMANPITCFVVMFLPLASNRTLTVSSGFLGVITAYILTTSLMSPMPPLWNHAGGIVLIVLTWIFSVAVVTFIKISIASIFRGHSGNGMFYCGAVSQLGSALASFIIFFVINFTDTFSESDPCLLADPPTTALPVLLGI